MASALSLMKSGVKHMDLGHGMVGVGGVLLDTGVGFATSYGIGQIYHRYGDKSKVAKHLPKIVAAVGKGVAIVMQLVTGGGASVVGGVADAFGQAGVNAMGLELGLRHARGSTGKRAVLVPKDAALPAGATEMQSALGSGTGVGALGEAPAGRGMSWDQIEELAAGR